MKILKMLIWFPVSLEGAVNYNPWVSRTPPFGATTKYAKCFVLLGCEEYFNGTLFEVKMKIIFMKTIPFALGCVRNNTKQYGKRT